ncbi:aldo/keto reductase [Paraclostridium bifermentans]|uniref:aldo/keto reductase n=1 Tax=Paraclostridium bifermentans TaxID=1490 RepID=UPI00359C8EDD
MIKGFADLKGSSQYFSNIDKKNWILENDRYKYSKLGLGTFIGNFSDEDSQLFREAIEYALLNGVNFIDTAINYRGMISERDIGFVITKLIQEGKIKRNQFIISSKAGIIPGDGAIMFRPINYMQEKLIDTGILNKEDVYIEDTLWLTMNPRYFEYALEISRNHLNLETIDIYYMHELELSMRHYGPDEFYKKLKEIVKVYENMVSEGKIREYGMATWDAFQLDPSDEMYISLEKVMEVVESVSKNHNFKHLMIPINSNKRECVENKNQNYKGEKLSIVECTKKYKIDVHVSGPLGQWEDKDYNKVEKYLEYLIKESGCNSYFVGTKRIKHLKENMGIVENLIK